ncbi:hypothetical protein [Leucobacter sp. gxy201]|uniref:hypothetical protein n=1 Tax=Leucobacter sp. gxy201 TaxID=2957200 RepID=UPI003DA178F6
MIPLGPVVARARVRAQRAVVWKHLVDPALRERWWPTAALDAVLGGSVGDGSAAGDVDVFVEGHALGFRWAALPVAAADSAADGTDGSTDGSADGSRSRPTAVLFTLRAQGVDTGVTVTETGFDALPQSAERAAAATERWQGLLAALVAAVDAFEPGIADAGSPAAAAAAGVAGGAVATAGSAEVESSGPESDPVPAPEPGSAAETRGGADGGAESDAGGQETDSEPETDDASADTVVIEVATMPAEPEDAESASAEPARAEASNAADAAEPVAAEEDPDAGIVPLVLPGPPGVQQNADDADELNEGDAEESLTGDPDFDALIRGDSLE